MPPYLYRLHTYFRHYFRSIRNSKGYGVHSPFAFYFISHIINPKNYYGYYCYESIEHLRMKLFGCLQTISNNGKETTVKSIAIKSASPANDSQRLFRLAHFMKAENIIELGTSLGIGTAYLASSNHNANVISIDHNKHLQNIAQENSNSLGLKNIRYITGDFDNALEQVLTHKEQLDLVFFDGNHKGNATLRYYNKLKTKAHRQSVFVFHDIHWSKDMNKAWQTIIQDSLISISIECYNLGIVFFNPEFNKQHFYA